LARIVVPVSALATELSVSTTTTDANSSLIFSKYVGEVAIGPSAVQGASRNTGPGQRPILRALTHPYEHEAATWVVSEIERLRSLSYGDLRALESQREHRPMETADGSTLGLETQVFWDDRQRQNLRVMVDVWDPSKRISRSIAKDDFIRAPDGSFVGE
jgi:hypothetical protein